MLLWSGGSTLVPFPFFFQEREAVIKDTVRTCVSKRHFHLHLNQFVHSGIIVPVVVIPQMVNSDNFTGVQCRGRILGDVFQIFFVRVCLFIIR